MSVPKYYCDGTYIPDFIPGNTPCNLPTYNERRGRAIVGGILFRMRRIGEFARVAIVWAKDISSVSDGGLIEISDLGPSIELLGSPLVISETINFSEMTETNAGIVVLVQETDITGSIIGSPFQARSYTAKQRHSLAIGSPIDWITSGISDLRSSLDANEAIISAPTIDGVASDEGFAWTNSTDDPIFLSHTNNSWVNITFDIFSTIPTIFPDNPTSAELSNIRTGPFYTLSYINTSEDDDICSGGSCSTNNGQVTQPQETKFWNGTSWADSSTVILDECSLFGSPAG